MSLLEHARRLLVVVGPSGAGKDSVLAAWAALRAAQPPAPPLHTARRTITRPADSGAERHEPVSTDTFEALRRDGAFATAWHAHGLGYGVRHAELAPLAQGAWVVLNSSREHLPVLRRQAPGLAVIEVTAPEAVRAARLAGRAREDEAAVAARLRRTVPPVHADLTLVNDASLDELARALQRWWQSRQRLT